MELEFSSFIFLFSSFVFLLIFFSKTTSQKLNLPPGPWKFPIIGNLHLLAGSNPTSHTLRDLANKYGPLMHLQLGEISTIIVSSPKTAKESLNTHDINFASRPSIMAAEINCYGSTDIAFAKYGEYWRQLRKICTLELLTAKRVQSFRSIREEEALGLCRWIAEHDAGSVINVSEQLAMANLNIMARAAFGRKNGEVAAVLSNVIKEAQNFLTVFNVVDVYPSRKFLRLFSGMKRKIEKHHRILHRITEDIIQERKREIAVNVGFDNDDQDLLDVLLRFQADPSLKIPLTVGWVSTKVPHRLDVGMAEGL